MSTNEFLTILVLGAWLTFVHVGMLMANQRVARLERRLTGLSEFEAYQKIKEDDLNAQ